jgi:predicted RNA polymerase sigma factor
MSQSGFYVNFPGKKARGGFKREISRRAEFHLLAGRPAEAAKHFEKAMKLARSQSETNFSSAQLKACIRRSYSLKFIKVD